MHTTARHWINGEWQAIGREFPGINPANGKPLDDALDGAYLLADMLIEKE